MVFFLGAYGSLPDAVIWWCLRTGGGGVLTSLSTILSFVGQSDIAKVEAYCKAEQIAKNECEFNFIESHCKALKTMIEGLDKITSIDCIVKICVNLVCCVITALFDIQPGNPVPLLYQVSLKMIGFIKHLDFIHWHANVCESIPQLPYIFLKYAASSFGSAGKFFDQFGQQ